MSIINHLGDPILDEVSGVESANRGKEMDVRALHIGVMNLMPDSAYFQTIKDVAGLLNLADRALQLKIHYINPIGIERENSQVREHAETFGRSLDEVLAEGVDIIDVTGADTEFDYPDLRKVPYIKDFERVVESIENGPVTSGIFQCFAFHVLMEVKYGVTRQIADSSESGEEKVWGLQPHIVPPKSRNHPLVSGGDTHFQSVSSRWGDISQTQAEEAGWTVLNHADTTRGSVGAAIDPKMNFLGLQTHAEYETLGLLKEWLRDWNRCQEGEMETPLPFPTFLDSEGEALLRELVENRVVSPAERKAFYPVIEPHVQVSWKSPGFALTHRYVSAVLKLTGYDRHQKYMDGVDPKNPLAFLDR